MGQVELSRHTVDDAALLLACLRGLPITVPRDADWEGLLGLASTHGVLPLVHQSLLAQGIEEPDFFAAAVQESVDAAETFAAELESLLEQFAGQKIDLFPLKGPVLAETLYGSVTLRSCSDLDLLVRPEDFQRAELLLFQIGFTAQPVDDYHRRFIRDGISVELHYGIAPLRYFPFDLAGIWARARRGEFRGHPIFIMSAGDLVLFLCLHGMKHGFSRLIWILDVARALARVPDVGYKELAFRARQQGVEPWLLIGCEMVREVFPQQLPREMDALIAQSPQTAARARGAAAQLFADPVNDYTIRSLYLQTERSARWRWRRRFGYFAPTGKDHAWAERHRIYRGIVPVLRPFRLWQKYGPSRVWRTLFPPRL